MAPEVRDGAPGDAASDIYTAGALLYFAVTGQEPPLDPSRAPATHRAPPDLSPGDRAAHPASHCSRRRRTAIYGGGDAGGFGLRGRHVRDPRRHASGRSSVVDGEDQARWEKRLRRALGDDYELLGTLGSGGFGRVYRVRDLHLEREVALKVLHPSLTQDPEVVERFRREAQLAAGSITRTSSTSTISASARGSSGTPWS